MTTPATPGAAGEVDVEAHRDSYPMGNNRHGTDENPNWGTFCVECTQSWPCDVSILADRHAALLDRLRVVEGERDAAVAAYATAPSCEAQQTCRALARAESAEAAHARLVAGVEGLAEEIEVWAWTAPVGPGNASYANGYENGRRSLADILRALLLGGAQ